MSAVKKILKFLLAGIAVLAILFGGMIGYAYVATSDTREIGNRFISHISANDVEQAYGMLHKNLQAKLSAADFNAMINNAQLNTIKSVSWNSWNKDFGSDVEKVGGIGTSSLNPNAQAEVTIEVTEVENDGKPGILSFDFKPAEGSAQ